VTLENLLEVGLAKLEQATFCTPSAATEQAAAEARQLLSDLGAEGIIDRLRNPIATKS
jgi:hypothetical protein